MFPLRSFLDMEMTGDEPGVGVASVDLADQHLNPYGVVHGAVLFAMVDTAMGKATMSVVDDGRYCASVEVSLRFIRPVAEGRVTATATVLRRGRNLEGCERLGAATEFANTAASGAQIGFKAHVGGSCIAAARPVSGVLTLTT